MNLAKAIEIETIHNDHNPDFTDVEREAAHQLGIEALKRIQQDRRDVYFWPTRYLPGETVE